MMHTFLTNNRLDLIERCRAKVALRPSRGATPEQLGNGVPIFLEQLTRTLQAEECGDAGLSRGISGASGGDAMALSEMGITAAAHGKQLMELGFSVDQVVHDYGDLCQAITDLAFERDAPFEVDEFRTLNRCLDNAIADAVAAFSLQRENTQTRATEEARNQHLGSLLHELRNSMATAVLATAALERGNLPMAGATGSVLKRSLDTMKRLVDTAIVEVKPEPPSGPQPTFLLAGFIADAASSAGLHAKASGVRLFVADVDPSTRVAGTREQLLPALANLLQNAFKYTHPGTQVSLTTRSTTDLVHILVADECGGLPGGDFEQMFSPFSQRSTDRSGLGLGLSIARKSVEADGGTLTVRDVPGHGCVFDLRLLRVGG